MLTPSSGWGSNTGYTVPPIQSLHWWPQKCQCLHHKGSCHSVPGNDSGAKRGLWWSQWRCPWHRLEAAPTGWTLGRRGTLIAGALWDQDERPQQTGRALGLKAALNLWGLANGRTSSIWKQESILSYSNRSLASKPRKAIISL